MRTQVGLLFTTTNSEVDTFITDKVIEYMYDFGDGWSHRMTVTGRTPATDNITCIDGTGHGVGEDVNLEGWRELKAAYRAVNSSSDQREKMRWYEEMCNNGDRHGLGAGREFVFDKDQVNSMLSLDDL